MPYNRLPFLAKIMKWAIDVFFHCMGMLKDIMMTGVIISYLHVFEVIFRWVSNVLLTTWTDILYYGINTFYTAIQLFINKALHFRGCQLLHKYPTGADSIKRCYLTSKGNPIVDIRRSYDHLISTMGFPLLVRWHLYIESGPWGPSQSKDVVLPV